MAECVFASVCFVCEGSYRLENFDNIHFHNVTTANHNCVRPDRTEAKQTPFHREAYFTDFPLKREGKVAFCGIELRFSDFRAQQK